MYSEREMYFMTLRLLITVAILQGNTGLILQKSARQTCNKIVHKFRIFQVSLVVHDTPKSSYKPFSRIFLVHDLNPQRTFAIGFRSPLLEQGNSVVILNIYIVAPACLGPNSMRTTLLKSTPAPR